MQYSMQYSRKRRVFGKIWRRTAQIFRIIRNIALVLFLLTLLVYFAVAGWFYWEFSKVPKVKKDSVLVMNFEGAIQDRPASDPISEKMVGQLGKTRRGMVDNIKKATEDPRIIGILLKFGPYGMDSTTLFEIREALQAFRESGKKVFAFMEGTGLRTYLLASVADKIYMPPSGDTYFTSLRAEIPFFRKMFDMIGVTPEFVYIGGYKTAPQVFTMDHISDEYRETINDLLDALYSNYISHIAETRNVTEETVKTWVDDGIYSAVEAQNAGLVDELIYESQLDKKVQEILGLLEDEEEAEGSEQEEEVETLGNAEGRKEGEEEEGGKVGSAEEQKEEAEAEEGEKAEDSGQKAEAEKGEQAEGSGQKAAEEEEEEEEEEPELNKITNAQYVRVKVSVPGLHRKGEKIAVVYARGSIMSGKSEPPSSNNPTIGSDSMTELLESLAEDDDIKGIILRINSGGGGSRASDIIRHAVNEAKQEKPVVVSMAGAAASGGYMISAPADSIVAYPLTITGSIGIFGGKFSLKGLLDFVGIHIEMIQRGKNAGVFSSARSWTEGERETFRRNVQQGYDDFIRHVAEGRAMTVAEVDEVAQGRVWTGARALELGLVDKLGGLDTAIEVIKEKLEIPEEDEIKIVEYPKMDSPLEQLLHELRGYPIQTNLPREFRQIQDYLQELAQLQQETLFAWFPVRIVME